MNTHNDVPLGPTCVLAWFHLIFGQAGCMTPCPRGSSTPPICGGGGAPASPTTAIHRRPSRLRCMEPTTRCVTAYPKRGDTSADAPTVSNWTSISDPCWTRVPPTISPMLFCAGWMGGCHPPPPNLVPNHSVIDHMGYDAPPMVKIEDLPISAVFPSQQHRSAPGQPG